MKEEPQIWLAFLNFRKFKMASDFLLWHSQQATLQAQEEYEQKLFIDGAPAYQIAPAERQAQQGGCCVVKTS
ncbi:hypothetical protein QO239_27890 [Cupriavidus taiwanensis]|uniref:hypothetical protein n=1 Tax=Cupriavidus taiwanensis TaxID=164546 RepID=UPI002540A54D|nr:hypothetical protein [Cupriavidus taiwanensis]MDK3026433.1 hypothetical protein [Cupriavidus taiwanensis]